MSKSILTQLSKLFGPHQPELHLLNKKSRILIKYTHNNYKSSVLLDILTHIQTVIIQTLFFSLHIFIKIVISMYS